MAVTLQLAPSQAWAWGERGHDLISRSAVRVASERYGENFAAPFVIKDHMLGHLSNVPDIYWRNIGKKISDSNGPTHYVDMEYLHYNPSLVNMPRTIKQATANLKKFCKKKPQGYKCPKGAEENPDVSLAGTAPWRINQLSELMTNSFKSIKAGNDASLKDGVDGALMYAGLISHFIGDLSQPLHNSRDYDGWEKDQGGLHRYFETEVVGTYSFSFDQKVLEASLTKPSDKIVKSLKKKERNDPIALSFALGMFSFKRLPSLFSTDKQVALTKTSSRKDGLKLYAKRKKPSETASSFEPMIVSQMGLAADMLARVWHNAWKKAGSPDLKSYKSYTYPISPDYIEPDYLLEAPAKSKSP